MNESSQISLPEALLAFAYVGIADAAGIALLLVGFDDFLILDITTLPVTQIYFRMKGVKANFDLVMGIAEIIPYVGALPLKTIGVIGVIAMDWASATSKITDVAKPALKLVYQREINKDRNESENEKIAA